MVDVLEQVVGHGQEGLMQHKANFQLKETILAAKSRCAKVCALPHTMPIPTP